MHNTIVCLSLVVIQSVNMGGNVANTQNAMCGELVQLKVQSCKVNILCTWPVLYKVHNRQFVRL